MAKQQTKKKQTATPVILKPGDEGYDADKDPMVVGHSFGSFNFSVYGKKKEDLTPYDFLSDPETGIRPGEKQKPWGTSNTDISKGIKWNPTLPPLKIWREGGYLSEKLWDPDFKDLELPQQLREKIAKLDFKGGWQVPKEIFNLYVTSGEGTPGNSYYRLYALPDQIARESQPKHPLMWPKSLKEEPKPTYGYGYPTWDGDGGYSPPPKAPAAPKQQTLPAGLRIRCAGCGHWFKMDALKGHAQVCPTADGEADWAVMCDELCGCRSLDEASKCKPGFPRPKKEEPVAEAQPAN